MARIQPLLELLKYGQSRPTLAEKERFWPGLAGDCGVACVEEV